MQVYNKRMVDMSLLHILQAEQADTQKTIDNIMKAIEQGIITPTTKRRMEQLENKLAEINDKILIEQHKEQKKLTKEKISEFIVHALKCKPNLMIRTLVKKLVLYDNKLEIYYNFSPEKLPDYPDDMDNRDFLYIDSSIFTSPCAPSTASPCFLFCCDCVEGWEFELRGIDNIYHYPIRDKHIPSNYPRSFLPRCSPDARALRAIV